ncbi:MAG: hypothetical protein HYX26_11120 [Acidobacteriales bacterium]|nr:hypothetical protein [Terriglobales bacterium]
MIPDEIKNIMEQTGRHFPSLEVSERFYDQKEALRIIQFLEEYSAVILGGDVLHQLDERLFYTGDSWYVEQKPSESDYELSVRSKQVAAKYVAAYPIPAKGNVYFSIILPRD